MHRASVIVHLTLLSLELLYIVEAGLFQKSLRQVNSQSASVLQPVFLQEAAADVDAEFDKFLEDWFDEFMARKPMEALRFGRQLPTCTGLAKSKNSRVQEIWGDASAAAETQGVQKDQQRLQDMIERFGASIGARDLSDERHVSYVLMQKKVEEMHQENVYRAFRPPFGPLGCQVGLMGCQVQTAGMIRGVAINTLDDARCYVALMNGLPDFLLGHGRRLEEASSQGATPYRLVLEAVVKDCDAKLPAEGNSSSKDQGQLARSNELFQTFEGKLRKVEGINDKERQTLLQEAEKGIVDGIWPAYRGLRKLVQGLLPKAVESEKGLSSSHGSKASDFYSYRVKLLGVGGDVTSLHEHALKLIDKNAEEIHSDAALFLPNFNASSPATVMQALRKPYTEARYANTDADRALYLKDVEGYIDGMWKKLHQSADSKSGRRLFFPTEIPALQCLVQPIQSPSFPGLAQYSAGSLIGKVNRSAVVGFNVYDMGLVSKMDMEVLAYHEVVPGHHLQVTKTLTLPLPSFRRFFGDEAFSEGWAVYAEQDLSPRLVKLSTQSSLGRLNLRQTKAVRLAVDTGLHALGWDRKKAEAFYTDYTMITPEKAKQAVDRHFAWPAQALNYAAGHKELTRVRDAVANKAELVESLGEDWEAMLHKAILSHGDLPLAMLEPVVFAQLNAWRSSAHLQARNPGEAKPWHSSAHLRA